MLACERLATVDDDWDEGKESEGLGSVGAFLWAAVAAARISRIVALGLNAGLLTRAVGEREVEGACQWPSMGC